MTKKSPPPPLGLQASRLPSSELGPQASRLPSKLGPQASRLPSEDAPASPWRSRGYLPHFDQADLVQSITFRLADSLPRAFREQCEKELADLPAKERQTEHEKRISAWLDRGIGECHLRDPRIAGLVENALLHFDGERYRLLCWCVMPNHVHAMIETLTAYPLDKVLHSWKSFTSKEANRILTRMGKFWHPEYHDRFIRDDDHFANAFRYIEENPVKAGLVAEAEDWRWSSAWKGREAGGTPAVPARREAGGTPAVPALKKKAGGTPAVPAKS